jgi:hypothetical protein
MPENAFLMIPDPSGLVMGTAEDMRATAEARAKVKGSLIQGYAAKSGKPDADIAALMAAETWLDAKDALDFGFIDRIAEPVRLAATFDVARFRNAPPEVVEAVTEPLPPTVLRRPGSDDEGGGGGAMLGKTTSPSRHRNASRGSIDADGQGAGASAPPAHPSGPRAVFPPTLLDAMAFAPRPSPMRAP